MYPPDRVSRFWDKVAIAGPDECWLWRGAAGPNGYGRFKVGYYGSQHAHRVCLEIVTGKSLAGQYACHHCDVKLCVNPRHLYAGNRETNTRDAVERGLYKGRGNRTKPEPSPVLMTGGREG